MEVADAVGAVVSRAQPDRAFARCPAGPVARADGQRPELVEGEAPVGVMAGHVLDPVQLGVPVRIGGLFQVRVRWKEMPRACRSCRSRSRPIRTGRSGWRAKSGELAQAPPGERLAQLLRPGGGRRDDDLNGLVTDQAGTASRPLRVQRSQALLVEQVDHVPDGALIRGDQPGDRRAPACPTPTP